MRSPTEDSAGGEGVAKYSNVELLSVLFPRVLLVIAVGSAATIPWTKLNHKKCAYCSHEIWSDVLIIYLIRNY